MNRARELYALAAGVQEAQNNLGDLRNRRPPRSVPSSTLLQNEFAQVPVWQLLADLAGAFASDALENEWELRVRKSATYIVITIAVLFLIVAWNAKALSRDFASHATLRHSLAATLFLFIALAYAGYRAGTEKTILPTPGVMSATFHAPYSIGWPLPPFESFEKMNELAAATSFPMRLYYWSLMVAALLAIALLVPSARYFDGVFSRMRRSMWKRSGASSV
jgi:hypothetical protein